jgi:4-hydroxy-tetrahydrodipicolinate reductase
MKKAIRILLVGAKGRMGKAIAAAAENRSEVAISGKVDRNDPLDLSIHDSDVVIDFSQTEATALVCRTCLENKKPLVLGTTGHTEEQIKLIEAAAQSVPILFAPNFSIGVNTLFWLTRKAAEVVGSDFDVEIVEMHHRLKKDSPSGTAKRLGEILIEARSLDYRKNVVHGRKGPIGERPHNEIGMHALRGGDVVGEHIVIFAGQGERLELIHRASSRETFALGALHAAQWIVGKSPGLYSMQDVLGL